MDAASAIRQIQSAGFFLSLRSGALVVNPHKNLNDAQKRFISANKDAIVEALRRETEPQADDAAAWDRIGELIRNGWAANFAPPGPDGRQEITWSRFGAGCF